MTPPRRSYSSKGPLRAALRRIGLPVREPPPAWAHGWQGSGEPFAVIACTECGQEQVIVGRGEEMPTPLRCIGCVFDGTSGTSYRRVPMAHAKRFIRSLGDERWVTWFERE